MIGESESARNVGVRGLPIPQLERHIQASSAFFRTATVDDRGRVGVRSPLRKLGWDAGTEVTFRLVDGVIVVAPTTDGYRIGHRGHLRIPAGFRHRLRLVPGDGVLLVALQRRGLLEIHPSASVEAMLGHRVRRCR